MSLSFSKMMLCWHCTVSVCGRREEVDERGETDRVGATIFPGLVKVTRGGMPGAQENIQVSFSQNRS